MNKRFTLSQLVYKETKQSWFVEINIMITTKVYITVTLYIFNEQ